MKSFTSLLMALILSLFVFSCANETKTETPKTETTSTPETKPAALTETEITQYTEKGKSIAQASFKALAGKMKMAMKAGGPPNAIKFCQLQAGGLTDSLSKAHNAAIKRTTNKLRNAANAPTPAEATQLAAYAKAIGDKHPLKPHVTLMEDNKVAFYAPIKMAKPVCLKCHGIEGETMKKEHADIIKKRYPNDQAMGYKEGELRGMWSITFDR